MPKIGIFSTYASGVDLVVEWKINDFVTLSMRNGFGYCSPEFSFSGERWFLRIYPNGWSGSNSSGHVDLGLCKYDSDRSIKQSFSFSLKTGRGEKYNEQHCTKDFDNYNWFHDISRFIPRSELTRRRSELLPEGVLMVVCTMKNTISPGSASNTASAFDECRHCKGTFSADSLSLHQKKCMHRSIKCPDCLEIVVLQVWLDDHECHQEASEDGIATRECSYCQKQLDVENISTHERKCMSQPVKCPDCSNVIPLRDWYEHDCHSARTKGDACASGSSISSHEKKLHDDLKELFLNKEDCDVIIKVKSSEIPAHRVILKARSPVFASTFRHDMKENTTGIVEIEDCDPSPFSDFLCFLYCGDVGMLSKENVFSLFTVADKYEVLDLKAKCVEFMKGNLTIDTFCETITLALQHSETELIVLATDFFVKNAEEILQTVKWQTFVIKNPMQSNELVIKFVKSVKHSNT